MSSDDVVCDVFRLRAMTESPRRPTMEEIRKFSRPENGLNKRLGMSMPNLADNRVLNLPVRHMSMKTMLSQCGKIHFSFFVMIPDSVRFMLLDIFGVFLYKCMSHILTLFFTGTWNPSRSIKTFKLPEFPPPLAFQYVQNYYSELISQLTKAISMATPDDSALLARYHYLRGLANSVAGRRVDALADFQSLHKTDVDIFPAQLVNTLVDSLPPEERQTAERRTELKRLISRVKRDHEQERARPLDGGTVKRFELPKKHLHLEDFVRRVQESGIVKDLGTINRLFDALTVGAYTAQCTNQNTAREGLGLALHTLH